ncbi:MAG: hypothetical protein IID40_08735 [Planctomycetes bacterium]|nr:hypothetical protein [Planctomycetota bacterium]
MKGKAEHSIRSKISAEFSIRLTRLKPGQTVRAVVMLDVAKSKKSGTGRMSRQQRQAAIKVLRQAGETALTGIDEILCRFDGKRLDQQVNALGGVLVEAPAHGIRALAAAPQIKAVLEDQPISLIGRPKK